MDNGRAPSIFTLMDCDVIITGGSLNGAALALALAGTGARVAVIDALDDATQAAPGFDGRSYALSAASVRMLEALGLWDALGSSAQPILDVRVGDGHAGRGAGPLTLHFDHRELGEGPLGQMIEDRPLRRALLDGLARPGIDHRTGSRVVAQEVTPGRITVLLDSGRALAAPLLIGADGLESGTARRAAITRRVTDYRQTGLVATVAHELPHEGTAYQLFLPPGPLAILPLPGNRSSIVWTETRRRAADIVQLDDAAFLDVLRPRFGDFLGDISLEGGRFAYPLLLSTAVSFTGERVALVGDAARRLHPIAGQGLNAGLRDVAALAEVLADARRRGEDAGSPLVLDRYAEWRRFDSATLAVATDGFNRLFSNDNPLLRAGRDIGLALANGVPPLRRGLMREAMGTTGDLPRLLRGERL